ncbi:MULTISPECIES: hypothetical protein [Acidianus]|uniref:Uncharacterized protein n=1 Tax=Candidatus Acidianus copahuensis TaxID=1160895 RepID=A0A031LNV4_9CREN|nr:MULTISPECIES: hypothetical protein [Acidianus]EZQ04824.1 hypothetical protein CM19_07520 [Candidatus Acidianus copahuensis]NON62780.1 hypothetical protein [Acidianus sp. RZ1]
MKLRIDKIPKNDEDIEEIQREIEAQHPHNHEDHEHSVEEVIGELYTNLQSLENRVTELEGSDKECKNEISRIYMVLSKIILAINEKDENERVKNLRDILALLEKQ